MVFELTIFLVLGFPEISMHEIVVSDESVGLQRLYNILLQHFIMLFNLLGNHVTVTGH